jgi:hypothetical protein
MLRKCTHNDLSLGHDGCTGYHEADKDMATGKMQSAYAAPAHTPTPWTIKINPEDKTIADIFGADGSPVIYGIDVDLAEKIVAPVNRQAYIDRAVNAHEGAVRMLEHLESWLRDPFFVKDDAHCLQKAYEVAQAVAKAEGK